MAADVVDGVDIAPPSGRLTATAATSLDPHQDRGQPAPANLVRDQWNAEAARFDDEPDHGLADPATRAAWRDLLLAALPPAPARIADLGCGTGTLTRLLVDAGYRVDGIDLSPEMIRRARAKVPEATFAVGDAGAPELERAAYDAVVCRHVLWALPDPEAAIAAWVELLTPTGRLVLVEGRWHTGAGLAATAAEHIVRTARSDVTITPLTDPMLWGRPIDDERYLLVSVR